MLPKPEATSLFSKFLKFPYKDSTLQPRSGLCRRTEVNLLIPLAPNDNRFQQKVHSYGTISIDGSFPALNGIGLIRPCS